VGGQQDRRAHRPGRDRALRHRGAALRHGARRRPPLPGLQRPEFWDGYFAAGTESYAKQSDLYVPEQLFDPANAALTAVTGGAVPTGS
jgi:hypothetical protein